LRGKVIHEMKRKDKNRRGRRRNGRKGKKKKGAFTRNLFMGGALLVHPEDET